jgi:hypothetical protein
MRKKKSGQLTPYLGNQNTSFSTLLDSIDPERESQRQEFLKRKQESVPKASPKTPKKLHKPARKAKSKSKAMSFDEKLERTNQWLQKTFPALFDLSQPKPLDVHIVRDIKAHYKNERVAKKYPDDLMIKAALYYYMKSPAYMGCLVNGAPRYNIKGEVSGSV